MTGSVMERSHAKLTQWAVAFHLGASSKKGFSAHQLHRELGCQYNTAWFLRHRVMEAMRRGGLDLPPMGGEGKVVEADETYYGNVPEAKRPKLTTLGHPFSKNPHYAIGRKRAVIALVERGGEVRSFSVPSAHAKVVVDIVRNNIARESRLHTDESKLYRRIGKEFAAHETINHASKEYARVIILKLKAIFQFSNGACAASISIAQRSICTVILQSSISVITIVSHLGTMTWTAPLLR